MKLQCTAQREGRLSSFLRQELKMSNGLINRLKWQDRLLVNGQSRHTDHFVLPGDEITVLLDEPAPEYPAEAGELTVIYEDAHLLAVDKPAGMLIHPSRAQNTGTLANLVAGYYAATGQNSAFHPLTRLDRDTFGIVLLAKNSHMHSLLQEEAPRKTYHALTLGQPPAEAGIIDAPIIRLPLPSLLRAVHPEGKPSVTEYWVLEKTKKLCKLALRPVTGRTHQLRLHCAHIGCPIAGDPQYGDDRVRQLGYPWQQLCAVSLEFTHPITGERLSLRSKMDVELPQTSC